MTVAYGDVPLIDPVTGRFPDAFAPPSVAAAVASTAQDAADAEAARAAAEALTDVTVTTGAVVVDDLILTRTDASTVNAGNVRGATGPANTLAIGTVTTLAAGSSATAEFTGTAPSQTLNLGLPTGAPSDWLKVGPGDPRTPAITAGQIAGTEPNGCTYVSTDGGGVGGYLWQKRGGAWVCVDGDTGIRIVTSWTAAGVVTGAPLPSNMAPTPGAAGSVRLRRIGRDVTCWITGATWSGQAFITIPEGFQHSTPVRFPVSVLTGAGVATLSHAENHPTQTLAIGAAGQYASATYATRASWTSLTAWPTTLPGSPA